MASIRILHLNELSANPLQPDNEPSWTKVFVRERNAQWSRVQNSCKYHCWGEKKKKKRDYKWGAIPSAIKFLLPFRANPKIPFQRANHQNELLFLDQSVNHPNTSHTCSILRHICMFYNKVRKCSGKDKPQELPSWPTPEYKHGELSMEDAAKALIDSTLLMKMIGQDSDSQRTEGLSFMS